MKVLLVQKILRFAGSEIYLLNLLPALRQQGVDAHFALLCDDPECEVTQRYKQQLTTSGVPTHVFVAGKVPSLSQLRAITQHLKQASYDLVHTHLLHSDMSFALIKTLFYRQLRIVSTKHGYNEKYNNTHGFNIVYHYLDPYRLIAAITEKKISRSFAVSRALCNLYVGLKISPASRTDVVYHGFDYADVGPDDACRFAPQQIVMVGRLTAFKGHRFAIQAMQTVVAKFPEAKLVIVGDGPLKDELQNLVQSLRLQNNVVFTGFHPQPRQIMATSDVVVIPSVSEAFGLVILEAMATRKSIVAFRVPTPSEILVHEETALLTTPFDTSEFGGNIIRLLQDKQLNEAIAQRAYLVQKESFTLSMMVEKTIAFYKRALNLS